MKPNLERVPPFFHNYIKQTSDNDVLEAIMNNTRAMQEVFSQIPAGQENFRYQEGKWSYLDLVQHMIDAERIFSYRALCIARKETISLPSFDENSYAAHAGAEKRNWKDLQEEFFAVRSSTLLLFRSFDEEQLEQDGLTGGSSIYVRALGFIIAGHCNHHIRVIRERYLPAGKLNAST